MSIENKNTKHWSLLYWLVHVTSLLADDDVRRGWSAPGGPVVTGSRPIRVWPDQHRPFRLGDHVLAERVGEWAPGHCQWLQRDKLRFTLVSSSSSFSVDVYPTVSTPFTSSFLPFKLSGSCLSTWFYGLEKYYGEVGWRIKPNIGPNLPLISLTF